MNDLLKGIELLNDTIAFERRHPDYDRVTALAQEYFDIFTGAGIKKYLKKYRKNESEESFNQMLEIYETTIPSVVHNLDTIFEKPLRSNRIFANIDHKNNTARDEILDRMKTFWQGETESGLDAYLRERWKHLLIYDPNAFIAVEFSEFDPVKEKPRPFAIEFSSAEAVNYRYVNGVLDWLICEVAHLYERRSSTRAEVNNILQHGGETELVEGSRFIMYLENDAIEYTEIDKTDRIIPRQILESKIPFDIVEIRKNPNQQEPDRVFVARFFNLKSKVVPAFRVGFEQDPQSKKVGKNVQPRTCLSIFHYALPFFKKELKSGAELDLTIRAHVFPKTFMYGPRCPGDKENSKTCNGGKTNNGEVCQICNGSGVLPIHTTSTDIIMVPWPKSDKEPIVNLNEAFAQFSPDIELVRFMEEYCDRLTERAKGAIFASQAIARSRNTFASQGDQPTTATEQDYSWDNVYDTYRPYTSKYSYAWLFIVKMIAIYTDNDEGFIPYHKFPSDYKLKPVKDLINEAEAAEAANLPQHVIKVLHDDIANVLYADDPDTLTKIQIKNKFNPFSGKSASEIQAILMSEDMLPFFKILYIYFDIIFDQIDEELGDKFYLMKYELQKAEIEKRVNVIIKELENQKAKDFKEAQKRVELEGFLDQ